MVLPRHPIKLTLHPKTISHWCQIVLWDPLNSKQSCPKTKFGIGYVTKYMVSMATLYTIFKYRGRPTNSIISRMLLVLEQ